jgi:hypothetical protein
MLFVNSVMFEAWCGLSPFLRIPMAIYFYNYLTVDKLILIGV